MFKIRDLLAILAAGLSVRACISVFADHTNGNFFFPLKVVGQLSMYITIGVGLRNILQRNKIELGEIIGPKPKGSDLIYSAILGVALLAFTLSENSLETLLLSKYDADLAHRAWTLYVKAQGKSGFNLLEIFFAITIGCIIAPYFEELYFRSAFLFSIDTRAKTIKRTALSAIIFTLLHFSSPYHLSTIVFSITLSLLYISRHSLILCSVTHASYNLFALYAERHFGSQFIDNNNTTSHYGHWSSEATILALSFSIIFATTKRLLVRSK